MNRLISYSAIFPIVVITFISIFFIPSIVKFYKNQDIPVNLKFFTGTSYSVSNNHVIYTIDEDVDFIWPTPNSNYITCGFGYRTAPTTGASTYHGALDIGAPQGSDILSLADGVVTSAGWNGANGYAISIDYGNGITSTYGHVSPNLLVKKGDYVKQGQVVAKVGPKYVDEKSYTTYKDSTRKVYQWCNNRTSPSFCNF